MTNTDDNSREFILETLNGQTGKVRWNELERHFAKGSVVTIDSSLDLVEIAAKFAADEVTLIKELTERGMITRTTMLEAQDWVTRDPELWAVVAAPWVLVQEREVELKSLN